VKVFVDTSAFYAVLDRSDANHAAAAGVWKRLLETQCELLTHNYVLVEACALIQHRLGSAALRAFMEDIIPLFQLEWINEVRHRRAADMVLVAARKKLSLVDCASFVVMQETATSEVFCFDRHFSEQGFRAVSL
jgi:predicted nucleic acid-binding protein